MNGAGLLQFERPARVYGSASPVALTDLQEPVSLLIPLIPLLQDEETPDDLEIISAALEEAATSLDDEEKDNDDSTTDRQRGEIIDVLVPPAEWTDDGQRWIQRVSRGPPSRTDVIKLWEQLDLRLEERQARKSGICPIRRALFQECFDELIRQVTLDCPERGLLLSRVRDEANMTLAAFQCLFESASEFGATKAIQAEAGKGELEVELQDLEERVSNLEGEVRRLEAWRRQVERRAEERREVQMTLCTEEIECLERSEKQYQVLIETLLASKS
ncbi:33 kDa inner dynein arm light chain, axonemal-like [Oratosquilla oratoria]|uniref:33 kDa inner dynein arm light chain, axonemal-like n=1 Tax=Oratosquilla oratoria TaxID=337810 RepID=UPI003F770EFA